MSNGYVLHAIDYFMYYDECWSSKLEEVGIFRQLTDGEQYTMERLNYDIYMGILELFQARKALGLGVISQDGNLDGSEELCMRSARHALINVFFWWVINLRCGACGMGCV